MRDALADLEDALALAVSHGDARLEIEVLLEQATALDLTENFAGSAAITERAVARYREAGDPGLDPEIALAQARMTLRQNGAAGLAPAMADVVAKAVRAGHSETETIARLLLAPVLAVEKQLEAAEAAFEELIAFCERNDDRFHLGVAYANRTLLWAACSQHVRIEADLRTAVQLARESGQVGTERLATHNLAEYLLWRGQLGEAVALARRGLSLQRGHGESATALDELLLARILAARGETAESRELLARLSAGDLSSEDCIVVELLRCYLDDAQADQWRPWLERAQAALSEDFRLELALLAQQKDVLSTEQLAEVRLLASRNSLWSHRDF